MLRRIVGGAALRGDEWEVLLGPQGLLHAHARVRRAACGAAVAAAEEGALPLSEPFVCARLWLACHDEDDAASALAREAWRLAARGDGPDLRVEEQLLPLLEQPLGQHVHAAAAAAIVAHMRSAEGRAGVGAVVRHVLALFSAHAPPKERESGAAVSMEDLFGAKGREEAADEDAGAFVRAAVALFVHACGEHRGLSAAPAGGCGFVGGAEAQEGGEDTAETGALLEALATFVVDEGLVEPDAQVRWRMLVGGRSLVEGYAGGHAALLLELAESRLEQLLSGAAGELPEHLADYKREGCVMLLGTAARRLGDGEGAGERLLSIVDVLGATLATPSAAVQSATAEVLSPLVSRIDGEVSAQLLGTLLDTCLYVEPKVSKKGPPSAQKKAMELMAQNQMSYGERRGAAVGAAAIVKGLGIGAMIDHGLVERIEAAGAASQGAREGALLLLCALSEALGLLFEPFVRPLFPTLLKCFADGSDRVRSAADGAGGAVMGQLSGYGVKLLLPAALKSLREPAWRTKQAAIGVLAAMAHCSPKQLSRCLPEIVPPLAQTVGDAHPKVRDAGKDALTRMGKVMKNPELAARADIILGALGNPTTSTQTALVALLACEFQHAIDAASLAFVVPILLRGLRGRAADQKRQASSITGTLVALLQQPEALLPFLDALLDGLKLVLHDAMPDVRATAARALAALLRGLGEQRLRGLVPWLLVSSRELDSAAARSGSAQGLGEALLVLGSRRCHAVLDESLRDARSEDEKVREAALWLVCFVAPGLGADFAPRLPEVLPVVLFGLQDEDDGVRDVARKCGQILVASHGERYGPEMLPPLEMHLLDESWRMRRAAVQLTSDLLCKLAGVQITDSFSAEDGAQSSNASADAANAMLLDSLGRAARNRVLALLYLLRCDVESAVRQSAVALWKTVVPHAGRVLREVTGDLVQHIVSSLGADGFDRREIAGKALGELVKKLGDAVLPDVLPFLRAGLGHEDAKRRVGVCMGLQQVFEHASAAQVADYAGALVPAVQSALCDDEDAVRAAAAQAFGTLHRQVGKLALDAVLPSFLELVGGAARAEDEDADAGAVRALEGLRSVVRLQPEGLLAYLLPLWTAPPLTPSKAKAMGAVLSVAGAHLQRHLRPLFACFAVAIGDPEHRAHGAACGAVDAMCSGVEAESVHALALEASSLMDAEDVTHKAAGARVAASFFRCVGVDYAEQISVFIKHLVPLLLSADSAVLLPAHDALAAMAKAVDEELLAAQVGFFRNTLASEVSAFRHRKGADADAEFLLPATDAVPKGLAPFLPMYIGALKNGAPSEREAAAVGLGELVRWTSPKALKSFLAKLLGPLIRIGGNRLAPPVKTAIIEAQGLLLEKGGAMVKTFVPQLQTTYVKALGDETSTAVRRAGAKALAKLMKVSTRVPQVLQELSAMARDADLLMPVRASALAAAASVVHVAGDKAGEQHLQLLADAALYAAEEPEALVLDAASKAMAALAPLLPEAELGAIAEETLLRRSEDDGAAAAGRAALLAGGAGAAFPQLCAALAGRGVGDPAAAMSAALAPDLAATQDLRRVWGCRGLAAVCVAAHDAGDAAALAGALESGMPLLLEVIADKANQDVRIEALVALKKMAKGVGNSMQRAPMYAAVAPVFRIKKGTQIRTRPYAERALVHLLQSHTRPQTAQEAAAACAGTDVDGEEVVQTSRKIFSRMPEHSDSEEE